MEILLSLQTLKPPFFRIQDGDLSQSRCFSHAASQQHAHRHITSLTAPCILSRKGTQGLPCPSVLLSVSKTFGDPFICVLDHCAQLHIPRVLGFFTGVKWPGLEFDHSPPHNNKWSYKSTSPIRLPGVDRDNLTL
jgi:hypothetical protein